MSPAKAVYPTFANGDECDGAERSACQTVKRRLLLTPQRKLPLAINVVEEIPMRRLYARRRGISSVQWVVIVAAIALAISTTVSLIGSRTNTKLNDTASDMKDVSNLPKRFGS